MFGKAQKRQAALVGHLSSLINSLPAPVPFEHLVVENRILLSPCPPLDDLQTNSVVLVCDDDSWSTFLSREPTGSLRLLGPKHHFELLPMLMIELVRYHGDLIHKLLRVLESSEDTASKLEAVRTAEPSSEALTNFWASKSDAPAFRLQVSAAAIITLRIDALNFSVSALRAIVDGARGSEPPLHEGFLLHGVVAEIALICRALSEAKVEEQISSDAVPADWQDLSGWATHAATSL